MKKIACFLTLCTLMITLAPVACADEAVGGWALKFDVETLGGEAMSQADFEDNVLTVMNVWATWCPPCVAELPHLEAVSEYYADQGVAIVGVLHDGVGLDQSTGELRRNEGIIEDANALLEAAKADYVVVLPDLLLGNALFSQMQAFPTTFFFDASGEVIDTVVGMHDEAGWKELIDGALEKLAQ